MNFLKNNWLKIIVAITLLALSASAVYYYIFYLPAKEQRIVETKKESDALRTRKECIDKVAKDLPEEETTYRIQRDRGCFLEAGGMQGITDPEYTQKFDTYNDEYYQSCLGKLKKEIVEMRPEFEKYMIDQCINKYTQ